MAFSSKNGIGLCDTASFNNLSRAGTSSICGITQGVSCTREPIITDGPVIDKPTLCENILSREPTGGLKSSTNGAPGDVKLDSILTKGNTLCSPATKLDTGWYVFWGGERTRI